MGVFTKAFIQDMKGQYISSNPDEREHYLATLPKPSNALVVILVEAQEIRNLCDYQVFYPDKISIFMPSIRADIIFPA